MPRSNAKSAPVRSTWRLLRSSKGLIIKLGLTLAVIDALLYIGRESGGGEGARNFILLIAISAFVWLARQLSVQEAVSKVRFILYDGVSALVKQLLILLLWTAFSIPFIIGSIIFEQINMPVFAATTAETVAAGVAWFVLSLVSLYLILRTVFAIVLVQTTTPMDAIGHSWRMTKNRTWWLGVRLVGGLVVVLLPAAVLGFVAYSGVFSEEWQIRSVLVMSDALLYVLVLPVMTLLLYQLYEHERPSRQTRRRAQKRNRRTAV